MPDAQTLRALLANDDAGDEDDVIAEAEEVEQLESRLSDAGYEIDDRGVRSLVMRTVVVRIPFEGWAFVKVQGMRSHDDGYMITRDSGEQVMLCHDDKLADIDEEEEPGDLIGKWALVRPARAC